MIFKECNLNFVRFVFLHFYYNYDVIYVWQNLRQKCGFIKKNEILILIKYWRKNLQCTY